MQSETRRGSRRRVPDPEPDPRPRRWRSLRAVLARQATTVRSSRALRRRVVRSLGLTLAAAALAVPFALVWGVGHAEVEDYLGPHRVEFASRYSGEIEVDLGPLGTAYLPSPAGPVGLEITIGGVGRATGDSLLSPEVLAAYASLYADPQEVVTGIVERLVADAVAKALLAEAVLLSGFALWVLRRQLLTPMLLRHISTRRLAVAYGVVLVVVAASVLAPAPPPDQRRFPVEIAAGTSVAGLTVDSVLLADLLDRGISGVRLLAGRQQQAMATYVADVTASMADQLDRLPAPRAGESMVLGYSDLHCNQAMTELLSRLARATDPALVVSSGDNTVNGTAAERGCVRREAALAEGRPLLVSTGNHDSDVTEDQMRSVGITVLDGAVVEAGGRTVLGDDDPEQNIPFSVTRTRNREETEAQLGERMVEQARRHGGGPLDPDSGVDIVAVHQPAAAAPVLAAEDPPARLVLWGHFHAQGGPTVVEHADGSWTVGMQQGTAGGVRQPTITSFSTPFSTPLVRADAYFYFSDGATGLVTAVQPVHFTPDARLVIERRIETGDPRRLPAETRTRLGATPSPTPAR